MTPDQGFTVADTEQSIAARFEHQVRCHGSRPAVLEADRTWTYEDLNRRANRIARAIVDAIGTEPTRVAIAMDKGGDYLASILAVLKAGHAYVPLDPAFPAERNRFIVGHVNAALVLTQARHAAAARGLVGEATRLLDIDHDVAPQADDRNLELSISPDALAYIIYTSGSTGQPKGVMQNQRNTLHGCMRRTHLQRIVPDDRMTLFYSCSVMGSVYCIFGALLNGAALCPFDIRESGLLDLSRWLVERGITVVHSVASVFRQFTHQIEGPLAGSSVRLVIFGGERVFVSDIAAARRVFSHEVVFFTGLGSTETGTIRHLIITPETSLESRLVPIGHAVEGMEVVLRSDDGAIVGEGQVGEIHVRSRYVALGYWNDEAATRRAFKVIDDAQGLREYRMGDLAELMPGGMLEHRGRKDFQVKIRGFRVEMGEVDAALQSHPAVREAAVKAQEVGPDTQLVGYVVLRRVADGQAPWSARDFRDDLRSRLPSHMVPTVYVALERLPRTPNGKVNTLALPPALPHNVLPDAPPKLPTTETQRAVLAICSEVLGRPVLGTNSNFFDVGGDSLSATRLLSRIVQVLGVRLSMRAIFAASHLEALADEVDRQRSTPQTVTPPDAGGLSPTTAQSAPATPAQRRLWLAQQLNPGSSTYNISNAVRLGGPLNRAALEQALNEMIRRHGSLRTTFHLDGSTLIQTEQPASRWVLPVVTVEAGDEESLNRRALETVRAHTARPLDTATGPVFDAQLLVLKPEDHILSLSFNHIVYDNIWSSQIFFRELGAIYGALCDEWRAVDVLPPPAHRFLDYALWEQQRVSSSASEDHLAYWRRQLEALPPALELPTDRPRPPSLSGRGGQVTFTVPDALRQSLLAFSRQQGTTSFMALLALWQLLLHRISGQDDLVVGTPTGRRYRPETEDIIGLFINNLVLRTRFADGMTFSDLLGQVRKTAIEAFEHDDLPFENLVAELAPVRDGGNMPVFRHFFIHRNANQVNWSLPGLTLQPVLTHHGASKFDLTLSVLETEQSLSATLEYSSDLFDAATAERMAGHCVALLTAALASPYEPVAGLNLLTAAERTALVDQPNRTAMDMPYEQGLLGLLTQQVALRPQEPAVVAHDGTLSYAELDAASDRLAAQLRQRGIGRDKLVGVCLERSMRLPLALLAVLKAGGAYVPLDPDYPAERLVSMLADSRATVLISETGVLRRWAAPSTAQVLILDDLPAPSPLDAGTALGSRPEPDQLAYVIYTSGSTGKPKGVQVTHRGLTNFLCAMQREPGLRPEDVVHAVTTVCFDIAALELFLPLVTGARVVIGPRELSLSPQALMRSLEQHRATVLQATPVTWRLLLDHGWQGAPGFKVLCGGEAMGLDLAERLLDTGCEVWNLYGPTETTVWSSAGRIMSPEDARCLGRPIANTQLLVTNASLAVQPVGVPGELMIGGDGLARGYLGAADLTRQRFIDSPLGSTGRLYRTGDLAVRRADGRIEFLGRADHQVKIRGFRVELGDVEAHLATHPQVRQAVVVAREDGSGGQWLVGYVVLKDAAALDVHDLHAHLKSTLPHYMVPSAFVALPVFPLTANGKIDRNRLPAPGANPEARLETALEGRARDDLDRAFLAVWQSVLQRDDLTIDADFFASGGNSMLAIRLVQELRRTTGIDYPLLALFEAPSIRQLIARAGTAAERAASVVRLNEVQHGTPIYCLAGVQLYKALADRLPDHPVFGVYARRELNSVQAEVEGQSIRVPIDELVQHYADAIERHVEGQPVVLAGLSFGGLLALEVAAALRSRGMAVSQVVLFDTTPVGAYSRSPVKLARDLVHCLAQGQMTATMAGLARQLGARLPTRRPPSPVRRQDAAAVTSAITITPASISAGSSNLQSQVFRSMAAGVDLKGKRYPVQALLIKASQKSLGLGVTLKPDYGFGAVLDGQLSIATVDADHLGVIADQALDVVIDHLRRFLGDLPARRPPLPDVAGRRVDRTLAQHL